jgi:DNA-binding transcriptional ArsR family regulator
LDSVRILNTDREAKLVLDEMRREILRVLAKEALTARKLSTILCLSPPTVGHHLDALSRSGFVEIVGTEAEAHGIVQKFYRATAQAYIVQTRELSPVVRRYFMPARIERTRGVVAALSLNSGPGYLSSSRAVETATEDLGEYILQVAQGRQSQSLELDPEILVNEILHRGVAAALEHQTENVPTASS